MSTMLLTDGTLVFNTSSVTPPSPTTLNGGVGSGTTSFVLTSGTGVVAGTYLKVDTGGNLEYVLIVSGSGTTWTVTRAQLGTTAVSHSNGVAVVIPGLLTYTLLSNTLVPNQTIYLTKTSADINYVKILAGGTNYFPGGVTQLLLIDTTGANGQSVIKFPSVGDQLIVLSGVGSGAGSGSPGPPGPPGTSVPPAPNILSATVIVTPTFNYNASPFLQFSGIISLPYTDPNYAHLNEINITVQDSATPPNLYSVGTIPSTSFGATTVAYSGITSALQPSTNQVWTIIFTAVNEAGAPTASPYTNPSITITAASVSVSAIDSASPWRDANGALHKQITITPVIPSGTYPIGSNVSFWLDVDDGNGPGFIGWWPLVSGPWSFTEGGPNDDQQSIFYPTDPTRSSWVIWAYIGSSTSPTPPSGSVSGSFTVSTALACPATDITSAQFNNNPRTGAPIDYTLASPGGYFWSMYQLQWTQPSFSFDPSYWRSFYTVQKGLRQMGTCTTSTSLGVTTVSSLSGFTFTTGQVGFPIYLAGVGFQIASYLSPTSATISAQPGSAISTATSGSGVAVEVWNPAPDKEGQNDNVALYWGRGVSDSVSSTGLVGGGTNPSVVHFQGDYPPDWTDPWVANVNDPSGAPSGYVTYRFWVWAVSILGMNPGNTTGCITLQTCWAGGADHFDLNPIQQPSALDLQQINPYTLDPNGGLQGGGGVRPGVKTTGSLTVGPSGVDVANAGITAAKMGANAITVANAPTVIQALAIVDSIVGSVGLNKLAATTTFQGTAIFTADAVFSRGSGNPLLSIAAAGLTMFSNTISGTGGDTTKPYCQVEASGAGFFSGANVSFVVNSSSATAWSVNGNTSSPYTQVSSTGVKVASGGSGPSTVVESAGLTIYSVDGSTSNPFIVVSTFYGVLLQSGNYACQVQAGGLTIANTSTGNSVAISSSNVVLSSGNYTCTITSSSLTLASGGGSAFLQLGTLGVTVTNGSVFVGNNCLLSPTNGLGLGGTNTVNWNSAATSASASAGGATLPAAPAQFVIVYVGSTPYKIPLYN